MFWSLLTVMTNWGGNADRDIFICLPFFSPSPFPYNHSHPAAIPRGCLAALKCRACLCTTIVRQRGRGSTFLKTWVVQGSGAEGKHRHSLLPTSFCLDRSISPGSLCPLSTCRVKEVYRLEEMEKIFVR